MTPLSAALAATPATVEETVALLEQIDAFLTEEDGLAWFNRLYLRVTRVVRDRIDAGGFANPPWMARLDVVFARYYFEALAAWESGGRPPGCWRALFSRRGERAIARIQFALAGVNAHINHDLPLALVETMEASGIEPATAGLQYGDYSALNAALAATVDEAKAEWKVRLLGEALPAVSHLEDTMAAWSLTAAREAAWTNAELLWGVRDLPLVAGRYLDVLDGLAAVAGKALLAPVPFSLEIG
jgi:hypothetical protein